MFGVIYGIDKATEEMLENSEDEKLLLLLENSGSKQREMALRLMRTYLQN